MEIVSLSSTNCIGLSAKYIYDPTLKYEDTPIYTENGLKLPYIRGFERLNDVTINNYSLLYLTNQQHLSSALYIEDLANLEDEGFSTYLAANAINSITPFSQFWVAEEPESIDTNLATIAVTGTKDEIDNRYFFDIYFIDEARCYIAHENDRISRYLTVDYLGRFHFLKFLNYPSLGDTHPQLFFYIYDRDSDFIVFYKNINDVSKFVTYSSTIDSLTLSDAITATNTPYPTLSIFRCTPRNEAPNNTKLFDSWVSYNKNTKTNSHDVNTATSVPFINSNLLINSEYYNISGDILPTNVLSLKNTSTPENLQYRNNPYQVEKYPELFVEDQISSKDYKKIFSGSNQLLGNDNITVGYETHTTDIVLKKDSITYFHMPQTIYPFTQINIAQAGLIEAGAIAGDHPLKSDKIFKKLGNYKYTSSYGNTKDETSGNFLCSWLSGNSNIDTRPIWVDRYYDPSKISFFTALTTNPFQSIQYKTVFECLTNEVNDILRNVTVFDKPSDLIFEPGTYYAYHHYGPSDVAKYINSLENKLVQRNFTIYNNLDNSSIYQDITGVEEFAFDGNAYACTGSLSAIQDSGQFTLGFYAHSYDWSKPFGNQIIGNFTSDGFGIFNLNTITPLVYVPTLTGVEIYNTDYKKIKAVPYFSGANMIIRFEGISFYFVVHKDGYMRKYNAADSVIQEIYHPDFVNAVWYDVTENYIYVLCRKTIGSGRTLLRVDKRSGELVNLASQITNQYVEAAWDYQAGWGSFSSPGSPVTLFNRASTIDVYNDRYYITPGETSSRIDDTLFYLKDNQTIMQWNTLTDLTPPPAITAFKGYDSIEDFEVDYNDNIWILADKDKYFKYTADRKFILSGTFGTFDVNQNKLVYDQYANYNIGFIADFVNGEYEERAVITRIGLEKQPAPIGNPTLSALSAQYFNFRILSMEGKQLLSFYFPVLSASDCVFDPTNSDYLRKYIAQSYPKASINVKAVLANAFDKNDTIQLNLIHDLSSVDPGYHHFAVRFDSYHGYMYLFIDGQEQKVVQFAPRKYKFSKFVTRPFLIGTSSFVNSIPLYQYTQKNSCLTANIKIKDFYLYYTPLNYYDLAFLARKNMPIHDIHFNVPCGKRNYVEENERYFKASIPGSKSTLYNVNIKNSGITDPALRSALEKRILLTLQNSAPAYSQLNKINWD